ncbi:MAG: ribonuclease H [Candidatus Moranbacteria bacterium CG_4_9_14_3_um_filter_40_7]|nr:MAG: ribonuclease H [Candidatus Moranbacteria bacterium CG23_combo_of_CG06-09_8_20_14_all_40_16]PIU80475.1 MAG: ribonuclease H [Candidatus Moranbacteria bacterium CG06_land_8_20_14_3_00_40_12]PJA88118.1 MAG: ribonuclease H [Candidatus Moranbacteria bacterium CG_4_9_14_3_um_filter_40_7]
MRKLYLDIETLPAGEKNHEALKYLFEKKKINKNKKENCEKIGDFEQYLLSTSFDGAFGRILCIAYAIDNQPIECLCYDKDEARLLKEFWEIVSSISSPSYNPNYPDHGVQFIGHNVMDFDLRFIYQRSIVNKIKPAYDLSFARYRSYPIFDTMKEWIQWGQGNVGLEHIALALGIPTPKDGIDGSQVFDFYQQGKIPEIAKYCRRDVEATRAIYKRMTFGE